MNEMEFADGNERRNKNDKLRNNFRAFFARTKRR